MALKPISLIGLNMATPKQHKDMAKLLRELKLLLTPENHYDGICCFCNRAAKKAGVPFRTADLVKNWIADQLDGLPYVSTWVNSRQDKPLSGWDMYRYRLAWIDHMIKILES